MKQDQESYLLTSTAFQQKTGASEISRAWNTLTIHPFVSFFFSPFLWTLEQYICLFNDHPVIYFI